MAPPISVSSKISVGLGESYELNAFHSNGNWQTQQRLLQKNFYAHVNRNKQLTARILQLRHPSGFLINSDQELAELLKTTFLGFFREDLGSTPVLQPRTQTTMADPLITELEIRRALDGLNPHKGFSLRSSKHLTPTLPLYLPECLTFHSKLPRSLTIGDAQ